MWSLHVSVKGAILYPNDRGCSMKDSEQRKAARAFIQDWTGRGDEKQETQSFWRALLGKVFGIEEPEKWLSFELPVQLSHTSFIDAYIEQTGVLSS